MLQNKNILSTVAQNFLEIIDFYWKNQSFCMYVIHGFDFFMEPWYVAETCGKRS